MRIKVGVIGGYWKSIKHQQLVGYTILPIGTTIHSITIHSNPYQFILHPYIKVPSKLRSKF